MPLQQNSAIASGYKRPPLWARVLLLLLCSVLFLIGLLFGVLRGSITNRAFFEAEYARIGQAAYMGMSDEDLVNATMQMIHYMEGSVDSIDLDVTVNGETSSMFNDRERAHMVDVRVLYQNWRTAAYIFLGLYVCVVLYLLWRRQARWLPQAFLAGSAAFLALALCIGVWVFLDFNSFWTAFHHLFFSNDLWLLDPATSRMINMMPLELFYAIVLRFAGRFLLIWAGGIVLCLVVEYYSRKKRWQAGRTAMPEREPTV